MHSFSTLSRWCTTFTLHGLSEVNERVVKDLHTSGETRHVTALQGMSLQRAIFATGMFSLFEAELQDLLGTEYAFATARASLTDAGKAELSEEFGVYVDAINVLKHGRGRSYDRLVARRQALPFRVKSPGGFFDEGDISEVSVLVYVDDAFVMACADIIERVALALR